MIHTVWPLPVGNAIRLHLSPPAGAVRWRILRAGADVFSGPDDTSAVLVFEGDDKVVLDTHFLKNNAPAFYRPFYWINGAWVPGETASGIPAATYDDISTDPQTIVRKRIEEGLAEEVKRGALHNDLGYIQVFTAPPQMADDFRFPLVTIELQSDRPNTRALGEMIAPDEFDPIGWDWNEHDGWLSDVELSIVGWSLNPDERIELRKAIRRLIVANLPVFDDAGMVQVQLSMQDMDMLSGEFSTPLYQCVGTLTCQAPVAVRAKSAAVRDVDVNML